MGGRVTVSTLNRVLSLSGLPHATIEKVKLKRKKNIYKIIKHNSANPLSVVVLFFFLVLYLFLIRILSQILNLAVPATSTHVNRGEFNAALALVGLAQKNMGKAF